MLLRFRLSEDCSRLKDTANTIEGLLQPLLRRFHLEAGGTDYEIAGRLDYTCILSSFIVYLYGGCDFVILLLIQNLGYLIVKSILGPIFICAMFKTLLVDDYSLWIILPLARQQYGMIEGFCFHCSSESYTLTDVAIPSNATNILVLLEGAGGEATIGVRSSGSRD